MNTIHRQCVIYPLTRVFWKMLFNFFFLIFTCYPLSIFKFPCLTSKIHGRRSIFKTQFHFSCWTIQLTKVSQKESFSIRQNSTFWARTLLVLVYPFRVYLTKNQRLQKILLKVRIVLTHCMKTGQRCRFTRWNFLWTKRVSKKRHL